MSSQDGVPKLNPENTNLHWDNLKRKQNSDGEEDILDQFLMTGKPTNKENTISFGNVKIHKHPLPKGQTTLNSVLSNKQLKVVNDDSDDSDEIFNYRL